MTSTPPTRLQSFAAGTRDTVPMLVGAAPFGVIFGSLVTTNLLAAWQGQFMSLSVFAGSSQFIALTLVASHAGLLVIWFATFIVNLRHMLYGASLLPHVSHLPMRWRLLLGFLLTDETFAVMDTYCRRHADSPTRHWYFLGSGLSMYLNWQIWTVIGLAFGAIFPQLQSLGLDFAMAATFIAIVVPQLKHFPFLGAALVAGFFSYVFKGFPYQLGLMCSVALGVAAGLVLMRLRAGASAKKHGPPAMPETESKP
jgi:4-azaleucine resistance transporter AzlC